MENKNRELVSEGGIREVEYAADISVDFVSKLESQPQYENIILIPPCNSYGDIFSIIGMIYFLKKYYKNVILHIYKSSYNLYNFYNLFFEKDENFNKTIFLHYNDYIIELLNNSNYDEYHICNTHTGTWQHDINNYILYGHPKINNMHYFCDINPLYKIHNIDNEYLCNPNVSLPATEMQINHIIYYKLVGLNNNVRMNYFNYYRNYEKEMETKNMILEKYGIKPGEKYNIINNATQDRYGNYNGFDINIDINRIKKFVKNDYVCIDINYIVDCTGWLCLLIEDAEELHLIEGFNTNFIYQSQYKNIINLENKKIYYHIWARYRNWFIWNMDYSWKMMDNPKLDNWVYLFDE